MLLPRFMERIDLQISDLSWDHEPDGEKDGTMWKSSPPGFATSDGFWRWLTGRHRELILNDTLRWRRPP
jgi:hypothetical protein